MEHNNPQQTPILKTGKNADIFYILRWICSTKKRCAKNNIWLNYITTNFQETHIITDTIFKQISAMTWMYIYISVCK